MADIPMNAVPINTEFDYLYSEKNGNQNKVTPDVLKTTLESNGMFRRVFFPVIGSAEWIKIMEVSNGMNCSFIINMILYANQSASIIIGYAVAYNYQGSKSMLCDFKSLIGQTGMIYNPNLKYKIDGDKISIWAKGSIVGGKASCITLLHGSANFPMIADTPPEDAIQPTW